MSLPHHVRHGVLSTPYPPLTLTLSIPSVRLILINPLAPLTLIISFVPVILVIPFVLLTFMNNQFLAAPSLRASGQS